MILYVVPSIMCVSDLGWEALLGTSCGPDRAACCTLLFLLLHPSHHTLQEVLHFAMLSFFSALAILVLQKVEWLTVIAVQCINEFLYFFEV